MTLYHTFAKSDKKINIFKICNNIIDGRRKKRIREDGSGVGGSSTHLLQDQTGIIE